MTGRRNMLKGGVAATTAAYITPQILSTSTAGAQTTATFSPTFTIPANVFHNLTDVTGGIAQALVLDVPLTFPPNTPQAVTAITASYRILRTASAAPNIMDVDEILANNLPAGCAVDVVALSYTNTGEESRGAISNQGATIGPGIFQSGTFAPPGDVAGDTPIEVTIRLSCAGSSDD